jgi:hypothetical protein
MRFEGAVIKEQGQTFGLVVVRPNVLNGPSEVQEMRRFGASAFGPMPIVLVALNSQGVPTYYGRRDIVQFLSNVPMEAIPWQQYTINAA